MVHSIKKALAEHGDKLDAEEKAKIETAIKEAEDVLKDGDKAAIEAKTEALAKASQKLGEKIYGDAQGAAGGPGAAGAGGAPGGGEAKKDEGDVVDAEFTEVKDRKP
jgi:molecular chaperone DnaK